MKSISLFDKNISCLFDSDITKFKNEITKQKNNPVCPNLSTFEVAQKGVALMVNDNFCLVKDGFDV